MTEQIFDDWLNPKKSNETESFPWHNSFFFLENLVIMILLSFPNGEGVNTSDPDSVAVEKNTVSSNVIAVQFVQQTPSFHQIRCGVGFWNVQCNESSTTKALPFIVVHVFDSTTQLYHLMRSLSISFRIAHYSWSDIVGVGRFMSMVSVNLK